MRLLCPGHILTLLCANFPYKIGRAACWLLGNTASIDFINVIEIDLFFELQVFYKVNRSLSLNNLKYNYKWEILIITRGFGVLGLLEN